MKKFLVFFYFAVSLFAHPVSYTIDLDISYNENEKKAFIKCTSNSKNKCGLYNIKLLDENEEELKVKRFPFLRSQTKVSLDKKPFKLIFFLRKTPEHSYTKIFE